MNITDFRTAHRSEIQTVPFESIYLTENTHVKGLLNGHAANKQLTDPVMIVRQVDEHRYALVLGYCAYITALTNHSAEVNVIVVPDKSRKEFLKRLETITVKTSDIKVPKNWEQTPPSPEKINACIEHYKSEGNFGKDIVVNEQNKLLDGYAAVIAAQRLGVEEIAVLPKILGKKGNKKSNNFFKKALDKSSKR